MTLSQALFTHISSIAAVADQVESRVYSVEAPRPAADVYYQDVIVISFEGATIESLSEPVNRVADFSVIAVSQDHLHAVELAETICREMHGYAGTMGGVGGVKVVDCTASEGPEDYDSEHKLFARTVALRVTYEF